MLFCRQGTLQKGIRTMRGGYQGQESISRITQPCVHQQRLFVLVPQGRGWIKDWKGLGEIFCIRKVRHLLGTHHLWIWAVQRSTPMCSADPEICVWLMLPEILQVSRCHRQWCSSITIRSSSPKPRSAHPFPTEFKAEDKNCSEGGREASGFLCQSPASGTRLNYMETVSRQRENE